MASFIRRPAGLRASARSMPSPDQLVHATAQHGASFHPLFALTTAPRSDPNSRSPRRLIPPPIRAQEHERQPFPDFVPDQFVVLYGIKSLAIKNINEFLYGVRAERYRKDEKKGPTGKARAEGEGPLTEPEPLLMPFWRGTWHGVPFDERTKMSDFEFYLDMLAAVARTVGDEHTLQLKSVGALITSDYL